MRTFTDKETKRELINILANGDEVIFDSCYVFNDDNGYNHGIIIDDDCILYVDDEFGHEMFSVNLKDEDLTEKEIETLYNKYSL